MKKIIVSVGVVIAAAVLVYVVIPDAEEATAGLEAAATAEAKSVERVESGAGLVEVLLTQEHVRLDFACMKTLGGKRVRVQGGWDRALNNGVISGRAMVNKQEKTLAQIEAQFQIDTLWSEHPDLTYALLNKGFFAPKEHPLATFISTSITALDAPSDKTTHHIEGNFKLNGIEKSVSFPAHVGVSTDGVEVKSEFTLNRKDFNVVFTASGLLSDADIDDMIALKLHVKAVDGGSSSDAASNEGGKGGAVEFEKLPAAYVDTIPLNEVTFKMVRVPGDTAKGIAPFFVGMHEVSWNEFLPWVMIEDVEDQSEHGRLRAMLLRPSTPYHEPTRSYGSDGFPALGMSRLSARLYAQWLSKQTGRTYRLPTEAEWQHVYELGRAGKSPELTNEEAGEVAIFSDNSDNPDIGAMATRRGGSKKPNALGVFDMAGNVCEWVEGNDTERVARGGHFESPLDELGVGRHVEDEAIWNMGYPNEPKSIWWFVDAKWVGFRLVCEPDTSILSLPATDIAGTTP